MKKGFSLLVCILMIFVCLTSNAIVADESINTEGKWEVATNAQGEEYLRNSLTDEEILVAFRIDEEGDIVYLDLYEHAHKLNNMPRASEGLLITDDGNYQEEYYGEDPNLINPYAVVTKYFENRTYIGLGSATKVTPDVRGPAQLNVTISRTITNSFGGDIGITSSISQAISSGASFTWHRSLGSSTSIGTTFSVPANKIGYVQFTPYLNVTVGDVYRYHYTLPLYILIRQEYVGGAWGGSPIRLAGGYADGIYELKVKNG